MHETAAARPGTGHAHVAIRLDRGWRDCVDPRWLAGWTPQEFDLGDGTTEVVVMGDGPPLVLIPPLPGFKEAWLAVAAPLAQSFRVVTFDLRCRFAGKPSWDALLADLDRVLHHFAPGPLFLAGHSMGGALAQQWTLARPERVRALVLSSGFTKVRNPPGNVYARFIEQPLVVASQRMLPRDAALALARALAGHGRWVYDARCDDRLLLFIRHCMRHTRYADVSTALDLVMRHDTTARVAAIQAPTLLLVGELESVFQRPASEELARLIPNARLAVSPRASHLHPQSSPEWFVRTVSDWLRGI